MTLFDISGFKIKVIICILACDFDGNLEYNDNLFILDKEAAVLIFS